jgi:putative methyltransferase (TIGR04325 family)
MEIQKTLWPGFVDSVKGANPLGSRSQAVTTEADLQVHNLYLAYAYVAALAAYQKRSLSILDWGSGVGHYSVLTDAVIPDIKTDYFCYDLPVMCQLGREFLPHVHFIEREDECFSRTYELVVASASLWYEEHWHELVDKLFVAAGEHLYLTRMMFVSNTQSYVAVQRPFSMGYRTEYLCWIFNRDEFVDYVCSRGARLVREFLISNGPHIHRAPEQSECRGFLFKKS